MLSPQNFDHHRAFCGALRSLRSALAALIIAWMPTIIDFVQHGTMTREEVRTLLRTLSVATLMIIFNFVQRFREKELPPARRRRQAALARQRARTQKGETGE